MAINPYYRPEKLNLELLSFDEPGLSYEYNTLCFWATPDGRIFSASDSGCSCPVPFEGYSGNNQNEVIQCLDRVGSVEQAESIFDSWNRNFLPQSERNDLTAWVENRLKIS